MDFKDAKPGTSAGRKKRRGRTGLTKRNQGVASRYKGKGESMKGKNHT